MNWKLFCSVYFLFECLSQLALYRSVWASPLLDDHYSYKGVVGGVVNFDSFPIYAQPIEEEIVSLLKKSTYLDFSDAGYVFYQGKMKELNNLPSFSSEMKSQDLGGFSSLFAELFNLQVRAAFLSQIKKQEASFQIVSSLMLPGNAEIIRTVEIVVDNPKNIESFKLAVRKNMIELLKRVPFDATVIRRDGFRVVLDRGRDFFQEGHQIPVYTMEKKEAGVQFLETGLIGITRVEENISFGKIMVERRPLEVTRLNKVRRGETTSRDVASLLDEEFERGPNALFESSFEVSKGELGFIDLNVGASSLTLSNVDSRGNAFSTNLVVPSGTFASQLWLTSKYFLDFGFKYGMSSLVNTPAGSSGEPVSSSISDVRGGFGYQMNLSAPEMGPVIHFKIGYGKKSVVADTLREPLLFTSTQYAGPLLGGGIRFGVNEKWGMGFDIETLLFPGISETPVTTGALKKNVSAWDFTLKSYYNWTRDMDLTAKVFFQKLGAEYSGAKTRNSTISSTSQNSLGFSIGVSYFY